MKNVYNKIRPYVPYAFALLIFGLFYYMTSKTPLAGDDWGYAINGMKQNPFKTAFEFYQSWSGRFFSELWGFIVAPRKWLWNLLNPLFFALIYYFVYKIGSLKKEAGLLSGMVLFAMMLNVNADLRMQTYTWIMGTTYVIPLLLSLGYFFFVLKEFDTLEEMPKWLQGILLFVCFYIGLTMENIAAVVVFGELLLIIHYYFKHKKVSRFLVISIAISLLSFVIMRSSPGSAFRLMRDHPEFNALPILNKIQINLPYFIQYTFTGHKFTLLFFTVVLGGLMVFDGRPLNPLKIALGLYLIFILFLLFYDNIARFLPSAFLSRITDPADSIGRILWLLYIVVAFVIILLYVEDPSVKLIALFFITLGGSSNLIMMMSPIFGARSALYFVYFIIVTTVLLLNEFAHKMGIFVWPLLIVALALSLLRVREYGYKYAAVDAVQKERLSIIEYYRTHPEDKEVHIPRMPIYSIHSGDVEVGDDYHFETFRQYFGLSPDTNIYFDWKESY